MTTLIVLFKNHPYSTYIFIYGYSSMIDIKVNNNWDQSDVTFDDDGLIYIVSMNYIGACRQHTCIATSTVLST